MVDSKRLLESTASHTGAAKWLILKRKRSRELVKVLMRNPYKETKKLFIINDLRKGLTRVENPVIIAVLKVRFGLKTN